MILTIKELVQFLDEKKVRAVKVEARLKLVEEFQA
jgi:hypothetical protein